jgi:hypothetical protein
MKDRTQPGSALDAYGMAAMDAYGMTDAVA